jgi:hypothetical protein
MGYERKMEKYSINLNVIFQVVSFDFLHGAPKSFKKGEYRQLNLRFYFLTFQRTVFNFKYKSLGKREEESVITLVRLAYVYYNL